MEMTARCGQLRRVENRYTRRKPIVNGSRVVWTELRGGIVSDWTTIRGGFKGLRNVMRGKATLQGAYDAAKAGKEMIDSQSSSADPCDCN